MQIIAYRLRPGDDLKRSLEDLVKKQSIKAGFILTCVGGLQAATVRMAGAKPDKQDIRTFHGDFEIVSLVGTLSPDGIHAHMSFSDRAGKVYGGHLKEGSIVHPTTELVIGVEQSRTFSREHDSDTGFDELVVR